MNALIRHATTVAFTAADTERTIATDWRVGW